jgi:hypothetical protein
MGALVGVAGEAGPGAEPVPPRRGGEGGARFPHQEVEPRRVDARVVAHQVGHAGHPQHAADAGVDHLARASVTLTRGEAASSATAETGCSP